MAISTMTLAKAILVAKAGLAAAAAAMALAACGPAPTGTAPASTAPAGTAVGPATAQAPLKPLAPAATRRLLQAASPAATLWGLDFRSTYHRYAKVVTYTPAWMEDRGGRPFWHRSNTYVDHVAIGWETDKTFAGDGEVHDLTGGRFLYTVPQGRVLIVNRVVNPDRVAINGYSLAGLAGDDVAFVFGPGEAVLFGFPASPSRTERMGRDAKVQGFTADPALLGGAGVAGAAFAK